MLEPRKVLPIVAGAAALAAAPAVASTVVHARTLKRLERKAEERGFSRAPMYSALEPFPEEGRSMSHVMEGLKSIPFNPRRYGGLTSTLLFSMADMIPMLLETRKATCGRVYRYPAPFRDVVFDSEDGTTLTGKVALHPDGRPRPALLMVHGLFGSKNVRFSQQVVLSAYYGWGYNAMALDLRFFGESKRHGEAPGTGGWKEGQDVIAAVRLLKGHREVTSVGVMGGSYGGAAAMCAAYQADPPDLIDGGIISWGGYGFIEEQVRYISTMPRIWEPFFPIYIFFMTCYAATLGRRVLSFPRFENLLLEYSTGFYGVEPEKLLSLSSPALHFDRVKAPLLIISAEDDPVVPPRQARMMEEAARDNENVRVWRMPRGGHCAFSVIDKNWMGQVARTFFNYWATPGQEPVNTEGGPHGSIEAQGTHRL